MKATFDCVRTMKQELNNGIYHIEVVGRALSNFNVGDKMYGSFGNYKFECEVISITAYNKKLVTIEPMMACEINIRANDYLLNWIRILEMS